MRPSHSPTYTPSPRAPFTLSEAAVLPFRDQGVFRSSRRRSPCPRLCSHPYASTATCLGATLVGTCSPPLLFSAPLSSLLAHRCRATDPVSLSHVISERVAVVRGSVGEGFGVLGQWGACGGIVQMDREPHRWGFCPLTVAHQSRYLDVSTSLTMVSLHALLSRRLRTY